MARNAGENNRTRTRARFDILPDVRGRHGIFPTPRSWRISAGFGCRRRILRNENRYPGRCRLPTLRNLKLCASWFRISSQSRLLARQRLSGNRIALGLRTRDGISASELKDFAQETDELIGLQLLRKSNGNFLLTRRGKSLADSITEAFL